jgi:hypothetical protein
MVHIRKTCTRAKVQNSKSIWQSCSFDNFEDWWRDERYGFELFCEKPQENLVTDVTGKRSKVSDNEMLIKINLKADLDIIKREIDALLKTKDINGDYKRQNKLSQYRTTFLLAEQLPYKEVALQLGWLEGNREWYRTQYKHADGTIGLIGFEYQKHLDNRVKKIKCIFFTFNPHLISV